MLQKQLLFVRGNQNSYTLSRLDAMPMQVGTEELEQVTGAGFVYCKNISLNESGFHNFSDVMVMTSVHWNQTMAGMDASVIHGATSSWTADVTPSGFTACVRANYHPDLLPPTSAKPSLDFAAFQINLKYRTGGVLEGGMTSFPDFTSASTCTSLSVEVGTFCMMRNSTEVFGNPLLFKG